MTEEQPLAVTDETGPRGGPAGPPTRSTSRSRRALGDGLRTSPIALGVLVVWSVVQLVVPGADAAATASWPLRIAGVVAAWSLAAAALPLVRHVLGGRAVAARDPAAVRTVLAYGPLALAVALVPADPGWLALALAAMAMTAPGVLTVVLDGSSAGTAVVRVVGALAMVPLAVVAGLVAGYAGFAVSVGLTELIGLVVPSVGRPGRTADVIGEVAFLLGAYPVGFLAGHLTTYVPLALGTPGPAGDEAR